MSRVAERGAEILAVSDDSKTLALGRLALRLPAPCPSGCRPW